MQSALFSLSTFDHDFRTRDSVRKGTIAGDLQDERRRRQDLSSETASANIIHVAHLTSGCSFLLRTGVRTDVLPSTLSRMDPDYDKALGHLRRRIIVLPLMVDTDCMLVLEYSR